LLPRGAATDSWITAFKPAAYNWLLRGVPPESFPEVAILPFGNPDTYNLTPLLTRLSDVEKGGTFYFGTYQGQRLAV
jgi:hypothetical protein